MVTVITAEGNKITLDRVGIEDFDSKYDFISGIYFEKAVAQETKKDKKTVAVVEEVVISQPEEPTATETEEVTDDELRAFLKENNVKSVHLFGRAKLLAKAEEYGFNFNK